MLCIVVLADPLAISTEILSRLQEMLLKNVEVIFLLQGAVNVVEDTGTIGVEA